MRQYNHIRLISFLIASAAIIFVILVEPAQENILRWCKAFLEFDHINKIIIAVSLLIGFYYTFYYARNSKDQSLKNFIKIFGPLFDPPINTLAYGLVLSSALRLIKGMFNQYFFNVQYFREFESIDISAILLSCIPLIIWSIAGLGGYAIRIFRKDREVVHISKHPKIGE